VASLDGTGNLHGMGIIAVSLYAMISRKPHVKVTELVKDKGVPILQYVSPPVQSLASVFYKPIIEIQIPYTAPSDFYSNLLWYSGWTFSDIARRVNWSGFMQNAFSSYNDSYCKSDMLLLPIIDLSPSDDNFMYSTLSYIRHQAELVNIPTPCVTFDQPLWLKAVEIIQAKSLNIVCRHNDELYGSIGSMMKGSGLEEALETVYAANSVSHMISGKAVSRALHGHFLVEAALVSKLISALLPCQEEEISVENAEGEEGIDCESCSDNL